MRKRETHRNPSLHGSDGAGAHWSPSPASCWGSCAPCGQEAVALNKILFQFSSYKTTLPLTDGYEIRYSYKLSVLVDDAAEPLF
jgi:hypothetical protein